MTKFCSNDAQSSDTQNVHEFVNQIIHNNQGLESFVDITDERQMEKIISLLLKDAIILQQNQQKRISCTQCTFLNLVNVLQCEMCQYSLNNSGGTL